MRTLQIENRIRDAFEAEASAGVRAIYGEDMVADGAFHVESDFASSRLLPHAANGRPDRRFHSQDRQAAAVTAHLSKGASEADHFAIVRVPKLDFERSVSRELWGRNELVRLLQG